MAKTVGIILALQDKCSPQLDKVAKKMNLTEKEAKALHQRTKNLAKDMQKSFTNAMVSAQIMANAVIGAFNSLVNFTNQTVESGDRIDNMSQKMQMSRQTFQELDYVFSQNGTNIEIMQSGMSKLAKTMDSARSGNKGSIQTFSQLGIRLKDTNGQLKSTENVMFEAISKLQKMPDGAKKSALAMSLFGKSATELAPLLNGQAKGIDELRKKFKELNMGMSDEAIDATVKYKDTMDSINRSFMALGAEIGAEFLPLLQEVATKIQANMPQIQATVIPVIQTIVANIDNIINAVKVLSGVFIGFKTYTAVTGLINFIKTEKELVSAVKMFVHAEQLAIATQTALNFVMNANVVVKVCSAIAILIGLLTALELKFGLVTKAWNKLKEGWNTISSQFSEQNEKVKTSKGGTVKTNKYASGTSLSSGGTALVGENGPELVTLPLGSRVQSANETKNSLGKSITINLNIGGSVISEGELINKVSNVLGRQLQTALNC